MSQIEVELEIDTGAGNTLQVSYGITSDLFLPIWEIAFGSQSIGGFHGVEAVQMASYLDGAIESIRWSPLAYQGLTVPQKEGIEKAADYLERWRELCRQHPRCRIRVLGVSVVFPAPPSA
jgi:hypothetical protein